MAWCAEVKWSNRAAEGQENLEHVIGFAKKHGLKDIRIASRGIAGDKIQDGVKPDIRPAAMWCYAIGRDTLSRDENKKGTAL